MNSQINLIKNALEYYDKSNSQYSKILKKIHRHSFDDVVGDIDNSKIILYDKNGNKLLSAEYQIIGYYYNLFKLWIWSWAIPHFPKNSTKLSRKILSYGIDYDIANDDINMCMFRAKLITSRFIIKNNYQLDVHLAISGYLSKQPIYYKYKTLLDNNDENNYTTTYLALINIKTY